MASGPPAERTRQPARRGRPARRPAGAVRLNAERGALLTQLRMATGLGGRQRRMGGSAERARVAVRAAIATAIARIERRDRGVARLLRDRIRTGASCRYDLNPDHPVNWIIR